MSDKSVYLVIVSHTETGEERVAGVAARTRSDAHKAAQKLFSPIRVAIRDSIRLPGTLEEAQQNVPRIIEEVKQRELPASQVPQEVTP